MKKNVPIYMEGVGYFIPAIEGYAVGHDGFSKATSNTQRPPPPKPSESAYNSTTFLSMIGKKEVTEKTSSAKTSGCHQ